MNYQIAKYCNKTGDLLEIFNIQERVFYGMWSTIESKAEPCWDVIPLDASVGEVLSRYDIYLNFNEQDHQYFVERSR